MGSNGEIKPLWVSGYFVDILPQFELLCELVRPVLVFVDFHLQVGPSKQKTRKVFSPDSFSKKDRLGGDGLYELILGSIVLEEQDVWRKAIDLQFIWDVAQGENLKANADGLVEDEG